MSSLHRSHANLLCVIVILVYMLLKPAVFGIPLSVACCHFFCVCAEFFCLSLKNVKLSSDGQLLMDPLSPFRDVFKLH